MKDNMKKTHEQFLEDLLLKNKHYREGKFKVVGQYESRRYRIGVVDHLNSPLMPTADGLLMGYMPSIQVAVDKSQYFKNMCYFKFGDDNINDLSQVDYINNSTKIKIIDRNYGEYFIRPQDYLDGVRHPKMGYKDKSGKFRSTKQSIERRIRELHPELDFTLNEYTNVNQSIDVKGKYGVCRVAILNLLVGCKPIILSAIDKNEYFINQAKEIHGDRYDYSLVEYKSMKSKVKIISEYGIFEQNPNNHLSGQGCPIYGKKRISDHSRNNAPGWDYTSWEAAAKRSKNFRGYKVYFLECWDAESGERFFKVGKTFTNIENRFYGKELMPYAYTILKVIDAPSAKEVSELEQEYKNNHKEFKYIPSKKFKGMYECFYKLNI